MKIDAGLLYDREGEFRNRFAGWYLELGRWNFMIWKEDRWSWWKWDFWRAPRG